jgi:DUF1365 family protein
VTNSSLYRCRVTHHRLEPVKHHFVYDIFMFCLDLDEIPLIARGLWLFGHNHRNIFEFRDSDHLRFGAGTAKDNVISYARSKGVHETIEKVFLITHLRTMGYAFNPVSFYFCFGADDVPVCCVVEVMNTYREMKSFVLTRNEFDGELFEARMQKYFYVSPFVDLDDMFEFRLSIPGDRLQVHINDINKKQKKFLVTSLVGERRTLTNARLLGYMFRFPFITLKIIVAIHWQALRLYLKKLPYHKKASDQDMQREVFYAQH